MKVYLTIFEPVNDDMQDPSHVFVKFGYTHHNDVMKRFDPSVDDGYKKDYSDFKITPLFSRYIENKDLALDWEKYWLEERFPRSGMHKVWVENYLGLEDDHKYDDTGVTELRLFTKSEVKGIVREMYNSLSPKEIQMKEEAKRKYGK